MYSHQSMSRPMNGGQLNAMMSHPGMVISSQQTHMMNTPQNVLVSQAGYPQNMMSAGQPPPQMMASQTHMSQQMISTHMNVVQGMNQPGHLNAQHQQMQQMQQVQMASQQAYMQQHQGMSHPSFPSGQARSPAVGSAVSQGTPGGPPSAGGGPPSNNPQTPLNVISNLNPSSQQVSTPATPQQAPSSVHSNTTQDNLSSPVVISPDPVSLARNLLLRDLRHSLQDWSRTAAEVIRPSTSRQQQDTLGVAMHNPMSVNPQSVNPQSVNPQSVNPLSANPSSVKSLDEPKSVENLEKKILSPHEAYLNSFDNFLAICDQIESDIMVVQEAQKQSAKFDKMLAGELKAVGEMANINYSQYAQGYVESTARVRCAISRTLKNLNAAMERMGVAKISENDVDQEKMEL